MVNNSESVRIVRVFVSSPGDVDEERKALEEVISGINDTDGQEKKLLLKTFQWKKNVVPKIGPLPQKVVDEQTPDYQIYIGILSKRFGTPTGRYGSGTEKEFRDALRRWEKTGSLWILFYFNNATGTISSSKDLQEYARVLSFREELEKIGLVGTYEGARGSEKGFYEQMGQHLRMILSKIAAGERKRSRRKGDSKRTTASAAKEPTIPEGYLQWLKDYCTSVDLLGLEIKQGQAARLDNVYVPLITAAGMENAMPEKSPDSRRMLRESERRRLLLDLLDRESLYVSGSPGSGKSMLCRWSAWLCCNGSMPHFSIQAEEGYAEKFPASFKNRLPVLVPLREFWTCLPAEAGRRKISRNELESALGQWMNKSKFGGLDWVRFEPHLARGSALLLLDGLDEVPLTHGEEKNQCCPREMLISGLIDAIPAWTRAKNRILLTSRPHGIADGDAKALGILHAPIDELSRPIQQLLIRRWFHILSTNAKTGEDTARDMTAHIAGREDLGPLSNNPMLLTAMCIVYHEGKRLPQDKSDLYSRTVDKVLYNRYPNEPASIEPARTRLSVLAYGMHTGAGLGEERTTPQAEADYSEIDRMLDNYKGESRFTDSGFKSIVDTRESLLSRSGLLLPRGNARASFYHFSFQEYLAAQRLLDLEGANTFNAISIRAVQPEWRNTLSFAFSSMLGNPSSRTQAQNMLDRLILEITPESSVGLQVLVADCLGIVLGKGSHPATDLVDKFQSLCIEAIKREMPVKERMALALTLGQLGDPRIIKDLRQRDAYVEIPAGDYVFGDEKKPYGLKKSFLLARYPVTNGQYRLFIDENGYENEKWWSAEGRKWLKKERAKEPGYWRGNKWNGDNQPVVGICFWEAEAFCKWAGGRLPTEHEWEAAARGPEGLEYPWGNKWSDGIVNSHESGLAVTSPAGIFPRSRSKYFGLEDMAGNVWEWTDSFYDVKKFGASRVLRGGGWASDARYCRSAYRDAGRPAYRYGFIGFRPARSLPSSL